ncbi:hypothetical protein K488DRAFT_76340 [Vararia minispora EC-137]|uniref:Uncharacterized protein n=1 Tax=Vararia minispora EC-137 TaxID=1314806 RepID=A0ACB8QVQ4_9AGAM|nr:hypothetical protein K488DRAFT_76340 [Vararia minispora EC-137]
MAAVLAQPGRSSSSEFATLPPLDVDEQDLGKPSTWANDDDEPETPRVQTNHKGKERAQGPFDDSDEALSPMHEPATPTANTDAYPPITDDEAESKRIEENLRRWETAERQRRKAARESYRAAGDASSPTSLVARSLSLLRGRPTAGRPTTSDRTALGTSEDAEDAVPLDDIDTHSPSPGLSPRNSTFTSPTSTPNPFADPNSGPEIVRTHADGSASSLFVGQPPPSVAVAGKQPVAPPAPLDLPAPRSPPPRGDTSTPAIHRPPEPRSPPDSSRAASPEDPGPPVRWWHEILCGCGEGPDRGGEVQAARTNPLE